MRNNRPQTDGITWISSQRLIRLRHQALKLPLHIDKIHASQGGAFLSAFKGRGMEYDESRVYLPGDDIRNMDWRVTARTGKPHSKIFQEERERPVLIWLDLNPSMFFATRGAFKSVCATQAAAIIGWSAASQNDRLGALIFAGEKHTELRPARGKSAVLNFIAATCRHPAWHDATQAGTRNMPRAMSRLRKAGHHGNLIFLISDFRGDDGEIICKKTQAHLTAIARHNDVILLALYDPLEATLPPRGSYRVSDGRHELQFYSGNKTTRTTYEQRFIQQQNSLLDLCRKLRMQLIPVCTHTDVLSTLQSGLGVQTTQSNWQRSARQTT
ncbi:hypothetical protein PA3071 [hydrothermal vent metagenome]|uniref:DUF58 domain-containing protein n=1 Tax=hydrothermal vent metagenome TaxID=652676 RepID=A0A3B0Z7A2_9ZZZZ